MKKANILKNPAAHVFLSVAIGIIAIIGMALPVRAGLTGPYTNDFYTLHLWHLQDTNGTIAGVATNGVYFQDSAVNPLVVPLLVSNTPGPTLIGGSTPTEYSLAGQPGPGTGPLFQNVGTNFGYALSVQNTTNTAFFVPWDNIGSAPYPDLSYAETNNSCSFVNTNTGAFTWEALIQPGFNPLTFTADKNPEILCTDGGNDSGPNVYPYTERAVQFRLDNATPSSGSAELEFNGNISISGSILHDVEGILPTTGPDAVSQGTWYHVAAAFTGTAPTNGDQPDVLTLYWTKFDPTRTNADVLTNFYYFFATNTSTHAIFSYPYPSNSIIGTGPFVIGNSARGLTGGWIGNIAEVRISDYYRHPNEFMFNNSVVPSPPLVTGPTTNNFVGYGQTLNLNLQVSGSQPYFYQWYQSGAALAGQTNSSLVMTNITYADNTATFYAIVTNGYGSATSAVATVTVGANLDGFFNTGCGPNYNPLDQAAPGSVDLHWIFVPNGNPDNGSSNAIVWSDASPLASGGGLAPDNGASVWIWAHENSGKVSGTYSLETTFQVDETVATNTVISGTVGALGASGGTTMQMFLNGVETDVSLSGNPAEDVYAFTITNGLVPGTNTLVCTAPQTGSGTAGNNGFNLAVLSDTGVALTNAPDIINQPGNVTNVYGATVAFSAVALGAPPLDYYWLSNGVPITPPVWVFTAPPYLSFVATNFGPSQVVGTNFYANYQIVFSNFVGTVTSAVASLDVQIPSLTVVSAGVPIWDPTTGETNIVVYFSGAVDPVTAMNVNNYTLNGATVSSVAMGSAPGEVILTTSTLSPTGSYTLTVQNVNSAFGFTMSPSSATIAVGTYPTTVALWVKASDGVIADGSGNVSQWNDLSTNGNNLVTGGNDPVLVPNAIDGQPMVEFTGTSGTYLYANSTTSLAITGDMSIFAVVNFATLAGGTNGDIVSKVNNNNEPAPYDYYVQPGNVHFLRGNGSANGAVSSTTAPIAGVPHILDVVMQGTNVTHRLDGNTNGSGILSASIQDQGQPLSIGARQDFHNFLTGGMAELILVSQALPSNDVVSIENYLATEYHMPTGTNSYPIITQEPVANAAVNQNGTLTVPAAASGTPAVVYQWYDINNIAQAGQTNATLDISNDVVNDSYYLVATNIYGSATSSVVAVTLVTGLNVSLGPPAIQLYMKQSVTLTAEASGTSPFYYQWYQNGSPIANATSASYTAVAGPAVTNYICIVTNGYNGLSSTNAGPVALSSIAAPTTPYQLTVLSNNPIAYWRLNEGPDNGLGNDGTIAYDYAGGHNGVYTNVELGYAGIGTQDSTDTAALFGVYDSSPSNSYVGEINGSLLPINFATPSGNNGEFSVEAWVNSTNTQLSGAGIVAKGYGNGGEQFDLDVFGGFRFFVRDASGAVHGPTLSTAPVIGKWYHVVGVFDGANGEVHLYTNGVDAIDTTGVAAGVGVFTTTTTNTILPQTALLSIGARASSQAVTNYDLQFQGKIQDVALYNYALSAAQVAAHYQASGLAVAPINLNPTNIVFLVTNNLLHLSWPSDHTGWTLQAQTNSVSVGLSNNWVNMAGSTATNQLVVPVNLTNGCVFYRLIYNP